MRTFHLLRTEDASGVSGTGIVAEGVQFTDGRVAMRWRSSHASVAVFDRIEDVETIHGHQGKTRVVWNEEQEAKPDTEELLRFINDAVSNLMRFRTGLL